MSLLEESRALLPELVSWRRHLHQYPELSFKEVETQQYLMQQLCAMGFEPRSIGKTGVVADIGDGPGGVAVRADIDALPLQEESEHTFRSKNAGVMHACGHDGHTAMLLGVAALLAPERKNLPGRVRVMFQPAEEKIPGGAKDMVHDGVLDGIDRVLGLHLGSDLPTGVVGVVGGPVTANADQFTIDVEGRGGHGSQPEVAVDAAVVAAELIMGLQTIVSRNVSPRHAAVITVGTVTAGSNFNIIAPRAQLTGTVRTFDDADRTLIEQRIGDLVEHISQAHRAEGVLSYQRGYPSVVNSRREAETAAEVVSAVLSADAVVCPEPLMAGEDFAYYLQERPGAFLTLGCRNPAVDAVYPHHHPKFTLDEEALPIGAAILAATALKFLTLK